MVFTPDLKSKIADPAPTQPALEVHEHLEGLVSAPPDDDLYAYLGPQRRWVQVCMTLSFVLAGMSLLRFSLHTMWTWPLLIALAINLIGSICSALSGWNKRKITVDSHKEKIAEWATAHPVGPSVDVFLPTCGEELGVLQNTYRHVKAMEWTGPLRVLVLDDADRPEVEEAAREFGFDYIVRENRGHMKKAGNLQNAYQESDGDFIVIFDADFCPRHDFLKHLIPYTDDP